MALNKQRLLHDNTIIHASYIISISIEQLRHPQKLAFLAVGHNPNCSGTRWRATKSSFS